MGTLFDTRPTKRMQMTESIRLTAESLAEYGRRYRHWCVAWSGGKDSTAALTVTLWLIGSGRVPRPDTFRVLYADTRQEILPLAHVAAEVMDDLAELGVEHRTVMAPLDKRMWVYILGRGVPPPNNNTLRYCTRQIKVEPMAAVVEAVARERGEKVLMLTGVRQGESAVRDGRIALSCSRDGGECGQGWFQQTLPGHACDTLAPLLHWRVCHVWEWLRTWAPLPEYGGWGTKLLADAYGGDEAEEINARTGCVCCPLASKDTALDTVIASPRWAYLAPLKRIRDLYRWLREPAQRLRKPGGEARKDGTLAANQNRMGPVHLAARLEALDRLLSIQAEVNAAADRLGSPRVDHLNAEEEARVRELIAAGQWPDGWRGDEPRADLPFDEWRPDGSIQRVMFAEGWPRGHRGRVMTGRFWRLSKDGDPAGFALYRRHYSSAKNPRPRIRLFIGPGEKMVLVGHAADAVFGWRKFIDDSGQFGVNCAVFRNESPHLSSEMIREAMLWAWARWAGERLYTAVDKYAVRSHNPGYCFLKAGWRRAGATARRLTVLHVWPSWA